jgi:proline iminopeptidase
MKLTNAFLFACTLLFAACNSNSNTGKSSYHDTTGKTDILSGGVQMIPIQTPKGTFNVWTKRVGNNPKTKVLLLHGGPGATH